MCGIIAVAGRAIKGNIEDFREAVSRLEHRGPDGSGERFFPCCWMGHTRLSIVDATNGAQPMSRLGVTITYNGELYNTEDLRHSLRCLGHEITSRSDTEIVLLSYIEWGQDCVSRFDGMFAFAIWDDRSQLLFLARDRVGKKPLYYTLKDDTLFVASQLKALFAFRGIQPKFDEEALDHYLARMHVQPWRSVYSNLLPLPPGCCATFRGGKLSVRRYWKLHRVQTPRDYSGAKKQLSRLLDQAVSKRIANSDAEVALFLSGGVDSSLVSALVAAKLGPGIKAFTVDYGGQTSETRYARQLSERFDIDLIEHRIDSVSLEDLDRSVRIMDEPHADSSNIAQFLISERAASHVKVILSGDGADETFFGYPWHEKALDPAIQDPMKMRLEDICVFDDTRRSALWGHSRTQAKQHMPVGLCDQGMSGLDQLSCFDVCSHLPGQIFSKVDRASMRFGLEVRSPFVDTDLLTYAFSLPTEFKLKAQVGKLILRDLLRDYTDHSFAWRPKQGFGAPIREWLAGPKLKGPVREILGPGAGIRNIFAHDEIDKVIREHIDSSETEFRADQRVWTLLCLERWLNVVHAERV